MSHDLKRWRSAAISVLAVVAFVAPTLPASAQQQPGESNHWNTEKVASADEVQVHGTLAEAQDLNGDLIDVWQGNSNSVSSGLPNPVFMSIKNGVPFQVGFTQTFASPAVAPVGTNSFMVIHTGVDNRMYWTLVSGNGQHGDQWFAIPGQSTPNTMAVSIAQIGKGTFDEFVTYRGFGNDTNIYSTWIGDAGNWSPGVVLSGGKGHSSPTVCLNNATRSLWAAVIGTDNQLWTIHQPLGAKSWSGWAPTGQFTNNFDSPSVDGGDLVPDSIQAPSCAATDNGDVVMAFEDSNGQPNYAVFDSGGNQKVGWHTDISGWQTNNTVQLRGGGIEVVSLITGLNSVTSIHSGNDFCPCLQSTDESSGFTYWKQLYVVP